MAARGWRNIADIAGLVFTVGQKPLPARGIHPRGVRASLGIRTGATAPGAAMEAALDSLRGAGKHGAKNPGDPGRRPRHHHAGILRNAARGGGPLRPGAGEKF